MTRMSKQAGLTLLELLVVITILVVLTVAIGSVALNYLDRGKAGAARLQIEQVATGLDLYRIDQGRYPTTQEGLAALLNAPPDAPRWSGPYVKNQSALTDPWGTALIYRAPGRDGAAFDLMSLGADGREGGGGEDADIRG